MKIETITLEHGYTADIHTDEQPANPWTDWEGEPPICVCYGRRVECYGGPELSPEYFMEYVTDDQWKNREFKRALVDAIGADLSDIASTMIAYRQSFEDSVRDSIDELTRGSSDWFDAMENVCNLVGVPCYSGDSTGYSQSDWARVFVAATSEWVEKVGAPAETLERQCKGAFDLWSAWAWGDVYGIAEIRRPDGTEAPEGSVWGFYGRDHESSGLMEHCRTTVAADLADVRKEEKESAEWACRDGVTVGAI